MRDKRHRDSGIQGWRLRIRFPEGNGHPEVLQAGDEYAVGGVPASRVPAPGSC